VQLFVGLLFFKIVVLICWGFILFSYFEQVKLNKKIGVKNMSKKRTKYTSAFKTKLVLELLQNKKIVVLICWGFIKQSFEKILTSKSRRIWIRRQINRNNNKECIECDSWNCCLMEFWKNNNKGDDCYGANKYVDWVKKYSILKPTLIENIS
jgi:uncharacterized protein (DUF486 family)